MNLTQSFEIRHQICSSQLLLSHLVDAFHNAGSSKNKILISGILKNCTFNDGNV